MASTIQNALKKSRQIYFLIECDFGGLIKRYSTKDIGLGDYHFAGKVLSMSDVGTTFNLRTFSYTRSSVGVTIINDDRLQDEEAHRVLDGGKCTIRIWCEGLTWANIEDDGIVFTGTFRKDAHDKATYSFSIEDASHDMAMVPGVYITDDTFPSHRKTDGGGSVSGKPLPLIFGDFPGGIPLLCVDTSNYYYAISLGIIKTTDQDITDGDETIYEKDGSDAGAANCEIKSGITEGQPYTYMDSTPDEVDAEPLSMSVRGIKDGSGDITGTADALIEHPADIVHYLILNYGIGFDPHIESLGTVKATLPGLKFASYINSAAATADVCQRILNQCQGSTIMRKGEIGAVVFDPGAATRAMLSKQYHNLASGIKITKTTWDNICNRLTVNYRLNMASGQYEGQITRDKDNSDRCNDSYYQYGEQPEVVLELPDVQNEADAVYVANRYLTVHSHRHDIVELSMAYGDGFDLLECDCAAWTIAEGASTDGDGYDEDKFVLLDRKLTRHGIKQRWWRVKHDY